jgi:hypothetical protein
MVKDLDYLNRWLVIQFLTQYNQVYKLKSWLLGEFVRLVIDEQILNSQ